MIAFLADRSIGRPGGQIFRWIGSTFECGRVCGILAGNAQVCDNQLPSQSPLQQIVVKIVRKEIADSKIHYQLVSSSFQNIYSV